MFMLRQAADWGLTAVVGRLIRHGIYINSVDSNHETALYKAVKSGHIKTARKLLAEGASPTLPDKDGNYPLHVACAQNNTAMVLLLLRSGALLEAGNLKRSTALHSAAYHGATNCIELLLKHGAKVNSKNINNHTPLEFAAAHAHLEAFSLLLENNADPTVPLSLQKFNPTQLKEAKRLLEHYSKIWRERHQVEVAQKVPLTMPARERAQAISKPKASYARRPSFFTGTIPESGQRIIFKEQFTVPDGNCGFAIFAENSSSQAVAQVRRDVSKTLLKLIDNFEDRKKLSEEILTLVL
ncbi:MAG: ankyrin repeat and box protein 2-like isoform [Gammaproteobacteria bacterium]|nr:ankyrin repeat and box protein 2-like isoform [Gammaproteobacteria bacterium]